MSDSDLPGTGVNPAQVINPTKRLKAAWRNSETKLSLKAWARDQNNEAAHDWLLRKGAGHTAEARKEHTSRVRVGRAAARAANPGGGKKGKGKR